MQNIESEDDFLSLIDKAFPQAHPHLVLGRGDDCAEIVGSRQMAVSTDLFVEDVHFRRSYFSPEDIGHKALAVNLSDMASAGAVPLGFSAGLMAPVPFPRESAQGILQGMADLAHEHKLALTGGDLSRGDKLGFCLTIWGKHAPGASAQAPFLRRGPVRPGDILFACTPSGPCGLGLARVGLTLLERHGRVALAQHPVACTAHLRPTPLVRAGCALARVPECRLMDISDGLARDLPRMLRAYGMSCGADLTLHPELLHPELLNFAREEGVDPVHLAFSGGEDYGLLGSCPPERFAELQETLAELVQLVTLGHVTTLPGLMLNGKPIIDAGFDHFA